MRLIEATLTDGNPVAFNAPSVAYIRAAGAGCTVACGLGVSLETVEGFAEIRAKLTVTVELIDLHSTGPEREIIAINPEGLAYAQPADDGCLIVMAIGAAIETRESYEAVMSALGAPLRRVE